MLILSKKISSLVTVVEKIRLKYAEKRHIHDMGM